METVWTFSTAAWMMFSGKRFLTKSMRVSTVVMFRFSVSVSTTGFAFSPENIFDEEFGATRKVLEKKVPTRKVLLL